MVLYLYCKEEAFEQSSDSWRAVLLESGSDAGQWCDLNSQNLRLAVETKTC